MGEGIEEQRFRAIFRKVHAGHPACLEDEWLMQPCRTEDGAVADRPYVWSRRNGPWRRVDVLWVGAAPGNAGGRGAGDMGAHATRIPFGGDVAGGNLDLLLEEAGLDRDRTFIVAALNHLPERGGGEPTLREILSPVGDYPTSLHLLRDTIVAAGPKVLVALGNVAIRATLAAARLDADPIRLPGPARVRAAGLERGAPAAWPEAEAPAGELADAWRAAWGDDPLPTLLWLTHPSAQNMSPYAGVETAFHARMVAARDSLVAALRAERPGPAGHSRAAAGPGSRSIYDLAEWREKIGPRHADLLRRWREKGV